jgi:transcriptional regulator with XRE-family HTH domain
MSTRKDIVFKQIGTKVLYFRRLNGLTQDRLAELANISPSALGRIERGTYNHNVSVAILIDIADALDIDFSVLLDFRDDEKEKW